MSTEKEKEKEINTEKEQEKEKEKEKPKEQVDNEEILESFTQSLWFRQLFGFRETIQDVQKNFKLTTDEKGICTLHSSVNDRSFSCGKFRIAHIDEFVCLQPRGKGVLNLLLGSGMIDDFSLIDVLMAQNRTDFNGATFQVASNYNCLEFTSCHGTASLGVTDYIYDITQGPFCALAAAPAILFRNYYVPHVVDGKEYVGQLEEEINLLEHTPIEVSHGYAIIETEKQLQKLIDAKFDWENPKNYRVGFHEHVQICLDRSKRSGCFRESEPNKFTNQVYCAALNLRNSGNCIRKPFTESLAQTLLYQQNVLTILCAWEASLKYPDLPGSNKLVLTCLGGGAFRNNHSWIAEAINKCADLIERSGLEVYVVSYSRLPQYDPAETYKASLRETIKKLGGKIIKA